VDVKKNTLQKEFIATWMSEMPNDYSWNELINKSGTTWRNLSDDEKNMALKPKTAIELILQKPSVMKRPVIIKNKKVITIGYNETDFEENLND
jgi:arsenate reductase